MTCAELLRTQAFLDGELDAAASQDAERHIATCAECQAFVASATAASDLFRTAPRHPAPAALRAKILEDLKAETPARRLSSAGPGWRGFWLGAGSGAGAMGLAAATVLFLLSPSSPAMLADDLVTAHTAALMTGHTIEVVSSSHHTVKPWFAGRIAISPPVADFPADGFDLVGGRVEKVRGTDMAVVVYRHGSHEVDLYSWADQGARLPQAALRHGYAVKFWKQRDLDFALVSDMENAEMEKIEQLIRGIPE